MDLLASPDRLTAAQASQIPSAVSALASSNPEYLGVILPRQSADIAPRFDGRLLKVPVRLGDHVSVGAVIAVLDAPKLRFDLRAAEASVKSVSIDQQRASVELSEAEERLARRKALSAEALASGEDLSSAHYQQKIAATRIDAAQAELAERHAEVERLRKDNDDTILKAPFEGVVAARYADPGVNVSPSTPIVRIVSAHDLFVRFAIPENHAGLIEAGRKVHVFIGERRVPMVGAVEKIAPEVDAASRTVFVEAQLPPVDPKVFALSGEMARVRAELAP